MLILSAIGLIFFSFVLIKSADITVASLKKVSLVLKTGTFALSAIILTLGTSSPEISVAITSAIQNVPNLTLGVVIGSNIANLSLIAAIASLSVEKVEVRGNISKRDTWVALLTGLAPIMFALDGKVSRADGVILLTIYLVYAMSLFKLRFIEIAKYHEDDPFVYKFYRVINSLGNANTKIYRRLILGVFGLLVSANIIVVLSKFIAKEMGIPVFVIGLIILAIGTSLPELAFSLRALKKHATGMFLGNILGSIVVNSTFIIGLTSIIRPIVVKSPSDYYIAGLTFALISLTFWVFTKSKRRIDWWEALVLLFIYLVFALWEFLI